MQIKENFILQLISTMSACRKVLIIGLFFSLITMRLCQLNQMSGSTTPIPSGLDSTPSITTGSPSNVNVAEAFIYFDDKGQKFIAVIWGEKLSDEGKINSFNPHAWLMMDYLMFQNVILVI